MRLTRGSFRLKLFSKRSEVAHYQNQLPEVFHLEWFANFRKVLEGEAYPIIEESIHLEVPGSGIWLGLTQTENALTPTWTFKTRNVISNVTFSARVHVS